MARRREPDPLLNGVPEIEGFKVLDPCVLYTRIGAGGMGAVYYGKHLTLNVDVAVKCLKRELAERDEDFVVRFQREAQLAAEIHHQNLVGVFTVDQRDGVHYLVMEYVKGETALDRVERKGPLELREACTVAYGAACGLAAAHRKGIVHRDVKPENIMIAGTGEVKLADLGLAKAVESDNQVTHFGMVMLSLIHI